MIGCMGIDMDVALYARVSTKNQDLERQETKLVDWAEREGHDYELYSEQASSIKERPEFDTILDRVEEYDAIAVTKIDRFARSIRKFNQRLEYIRNHDTEFVSVDQPIDTTDEVYGDFMIQMLALFADFERKMIRRRLEEGFKQAQEEGRVGRPRKDIDMDKLDKMYQRGASYAFMASEFDVSEQTISNRLEELGHIGDGSDE